MWEARDRREADVYFKKVPGKDPASYSVRHREYRLVQRRLTGRALFSIVQYHSITAIKKSPSRPGPKKAHKTILCECMGMDPLSFDNKPRYDIKEKEQQLS